MLTFEPEHKCRSITNWLVCQKIDISHIHTLDHCQTTWPGIVAIQVISSNNRDLMKNVYTQGIRAPDSIPGYNVSNLQSFCRIPAWLLCKKAFLFLVPSANYTTQPELCVLPFQGPPWTFIFTSKARAVEIQTELKTHAVSLTSR